MVRSRLGPPNPFKNLAALQLAPTPRPTIRPKIANLQGGVQYDAAGDIQADGNNQYLYNADGQICAVHNMTGMTEYIYDAEGRRVAEGSISSWSCDTATNGFTVTANYVRDQAGHQLSEFAPGQNGTMVWQHTNAYANGELIATEDNTEAHFYLNDWLGTRRVQTDYLGVPEQTCSSLPYGDAESCAPTPTENLFTGKERDAESGNDYFGARYYASTMGRFMSPDPSGLYYADPSDPQSFNLYGYVNNSPLIFTDPTGLDCVYFNDDNSVNHVLQGDCASTQDNGYYIDATDVASATLSDSGDLTSYTTGQGSFLPDGTANDTTVNVNSTAPVFADSNGQITMDMSQKDFIAMLKKSGFYRSDLDQALANHGLSGHNGIQMRQLKKTCGIHVNIDRNSGKNGKPVRFDFHQDLFNPNPESDPADSLITLPLHGAEYLMDKAANAFGPNPTVGDQACADRQ